MKHPFYLLFFMLSNILFAQTAFKKDSVFVKKVNRFNAIYKEFEVIDHTVYAVTKEDSLIKIDLSDNSFQFIKSSIKSIAKNKKRKIVALTKMGEVIEQRGGKRFKNIDVFEGVPYKILVDKNDDFLIVSSKYLRYKKENFTPEKRSPMYKKAGRFRKDKIDLIPADVYFIDRDNRVCFGYDAGEWGGDVCFFDLNTKTFLTEYDDLEDSFYRKHSKFGSNSELFKEFPDKVKIIEGDTIPKFPTNFNISNIKGVAQNENGDYYIAKSLMHFSVSSSLHKKSSTNEKDFYKDITLSDVLEHKVYKARTEKFYDGSGGLKTATIPEHKESLEYLGGIVFNTFDKHIYYYTNNGFWKLIESTNGSSKEFVFRPWILWTAGLPDAVGYQMNVIKFEFISEKEMVFLTSNNGIGYFNGTEVTYFR